MQAPGEIDTALNAAFNRAHHYAHDSQKIFEDSMAHLMLSDSEREFIANRHAERLKRLDPDLAATCRDLDEMVSCFMRGGSVTAEILSRSRYAEEILEEGIGQGVKQYVLIGAGMDTFAFRRPDLNQHLQVFEIDRPEAQSFKRQRLVEAGLPTPENLHFVPIDFAQENVDAALRRSVYDPQLPTCFGWLGVTPYLEVSDILGTLSAIRKLAAVGSRVVFDYIHSDAFDPSRSTKVMQELLESVRSRGEPLLGAFEPQDLEKQLAGIGFKIQENLSPEYIQERYFQGRSDGYHAMEQVYFAWATVE